MSYIVCLGEVMLRLSSVNNERLLQSSMLQATFGGVEVNVAVSCSIFGLNSRYVTAIPNNPVGLKIEELLLSHRVDTSAIAWTGKRVGVYYVDVGNNQRSTVVTYDREDSSIACADIKDFDWEKVFANAGILHITGVTAGISEKAAELTLYAAKDAKSRGIKVSCDINYRKKLWRYGKNIWDIMPDIVKYVDILFANEYDVVKILGIESDIDVDGEVDDVSYVSLMKEAIDKYSLEMIVTTKREVVSSSNNNFMAKLYDGKKLYNSKKYSITNIIDRVGTGDAFVAGVLSGLNFYENKKDILEFATAAACLKFTIPGDWNLATKDEVLALMKDSKSLDVKR